jgi:hypothetical protein
MLGRVSGTIHEFRAQALAQAEALLDAIDSAEAIIVSTIERECEALRTGRTLAAKALHTRLCDAARLYLNATKAARASLWTIEHVLPGSRERLDERRAAFADVLKVELAVLAAAREAADEGGEPDGDELPEDTAEIAREDRRPGFPPARSVTVGPVGRAPARTTRGGQG